jgi:hypothetical protein
MLAALDVTFAALTITEDVTPNLGTVYSGVSGRQFILNTDETVTGTDAADYLFGAVSGQLGVKQTGGPASANIVAENIIASGGLTVNAVPCRWHTGSQTSCDGAGINVTVQGNRTLYIGVDITTNQVHNSGDTASVTYDISITFL